MQFVTLRRTEEETTIVNLDYVSFITETIYGTVIHFASGEQLPCPESIDTVRERLFGSEPAETMLIAKSA